MKKKFSTSIDVYSQKSPPFTAGLPALLLLLALPIMFLPLSCSRKQVIVGKRLLTSSEEKSRDLLNRVLLINEKSVPFYSAGFTLEGIINKKRITSIGSAVYKKDPRQVRFTFFDAVFKSPITTLIQNGEAVKIYFPVDKTLYIDNKNNLKLGNYTPFDFDFMLLQSIAGSQIPLIADYKIKKELSELREYDSDRDASFLILENSEYYQTISLKNTVPDKILFLKKASREKTEVYLENPVAREGSVFYKTIRMVMVGRGDKITLSFKSPDFSNEPSSKSITALTTANNTRIIYMDR